jgi:hypothetical protein
VTTSAADAAMVAGDAITGTVGNVAASTGDAVAAAGEALTATVGDVATSAGDTVSAAVGDVVSSGGGATADVVGTASSTVDQAAGTVSTATEPVTQAAAGAVGNATSATTGVVSGTVDTATQVVNTAPKPVADAVGGAVDTTTNVVANTDSVGQGVSTTTPSSSAPVGDVVSAASDSASSATAATTQAVAESSAAQAVHHAMGSVPAGPASTVMDATAATGPQLTAATPAPRGGSAGAVASMDPALAAAPAGHDSVLHAMAEYSPAARVLVSAAIISSVVGASAAAGEKGGVRRLAFVNARLIPCLLKASVERQLETISTGLLRAGGEAEAAASGERSGSADGGGRHEAAVHRALNQVVDGFHDVVDGLPGPTDGDGADGLKDARLMTQIGMALGFVYLGFLTLWFWATRRREATGL